MEYPQIMIIIKDVPKIEIVRFLKLYIILNKNIRITNPGEDQISSGTVQVLGKVRTNVCVRSVPSLVNNMVFCKAKQLNCVEMPS